MVFWCASTDSMCARQITTKEHPCVPVMRILNICTDPSMRNPHHHDRWGTLDACWWINLTYCAGQRLELTGKQTILCRRLGAYGLPFFESHAELRLAAVCDIFQHYQISSSTSFWQLRATLLALLVLLVCRELEVAQWCETCPCDEIFAEYFYWACNADSLPPWSLRDCAWWRTCVVCQKSPMKLETDGFWVCFHMQHVCKTNHNKRTSLCTCDENPNICTDSSMRNPHHHDRWGILDACRWMNKPKEENRQSTERLLLECQAEFCSCYCVLQ